MNSTLGVAEIRGANAAINGQSATEAGNGKKRNGTTTGDGAKAPPIYPMEKTLNFGQWLNCSPRRAVDSPYVNDMTPTKP
jgi:hypothetical protein